MLSILLSWAKKDFGKKTSILRNEKTQLETIKNSFSKNYICQILGYLPTPKVWTL